MTDMRFETRPGDLETNSVTLVTDFSPQDYRDVAMAAMERGISVEDLVRNAVMEDLYR